MKIQKIKPTQTTKWWALVAVTATIFISSCRKELTEPVTVAPTTVNKIRLEQKTNPYSIRNVQKAQGVITNKLNSITNTIVETTDTLPQFVYFKFNPSEITQEQFQVLENDSTVTLHDFPFANAALYNEDFALDENKKEQLTDGNIYGITNIENTSVLNLLQSSTSLQRQFLDTLALIPEEDTTLQYEAMRQAGASEEQILQLKICLFKRPSGHVRYLDQQTGTMKNVAGMQVWALVFGIPRHTYTDNNGYYNFPWRFSAGTIMGTHGKNWRVNIKPINTQGAWWLLLGGQFLVGSVSVHGWVGSCRMRDELNFEYREHRQNRYWAQLMDAVSLHDQYSSNDGIQNAPGTLTIWAHWDDNYGSASAPMLGHVGVGRAIIEGIINNIFGGDVNLPGNYPNLFSLLNGLLPDITIKTGSTERQSHSARLMQTAFHELAHGSHFLRAGHQYWLDFIRATIRRHPANQCGGGYGCGQNPDDGNVAIGESWAEFIGTNHALRNHPTGEKNSRWLSFTSTGEYNFFTPISFGNALEREMWFFNDWIPTGIYNDLIDINNTDPVENFWDNMGGLTIQQLYNVLGPNIDFPCDYEFELLQRYPWLNINDVNSIFIQHGVGCL